MLLIHALHSCRIIKRQFLSHLNIKIINKNKCLFLIKIKCCRCRYAVSTLNYKKKIFYENTKMYLRYIHNICNEYFVLNKSAFSCSMFVIYIIVQYIKYLYTIMLQFLLLTHKSTVART